MASINNECDRPLAESDLDEAFERWWPDLEGKLAAAERESGQPTPPPPSEKDILAELLAMGRVQSEQLTIAAAMLTKLAARPQPAVLTVRKGSAEGASTPGIPANYAIAAQLYEYAIPADGQLAVPHLTGVTGATGPSGSDPKGR